MATDEAPRNELERCLIAAQEGELSPEAMFGRTAGLAGDEIGGFQRSTKAVPLSLTAEDGTPAPILFSSAERAKAFLQGYPGYQGGLLTGFTWVLEKMGDGYTIALNPESDIGFDLEPEMVQALSERINGAPH